MTGLTSPEAFTVLTLGQRGIHEGAPFTLAGQCLVRSAHGLWWTEWRLRFDDARILFLAESGGRLVLFREASLLPDVLTLVAGAPLDRGWTVTATGSAVRVGRWGENAGLARAYAYAELAREDEVATIEPPHAFRGKVVQLADLGLAAERPLRLHRVPELSPPPETGWLPIGTTGTFRGRRAEVIGCIARTADGAVWEEHLVRHEGALAWLVLADGTWSEIEPLVFGPDEGERVEATVTWAAGELPWEVTVGERSVLSEHHGITREASVHGVSFSRARPIPTEDIAKSFGKRALPRR